MTTFARSLHLLPTSIRRGYAPLLALALGVLLVLPASATAVVSEVESTKVGLQPRNGTSLEATEEEQETFSNENGNVVLHGSNDYLVYWDPEHKLHHEWVTNLDGFFHELGEAGNSTPFGLIAAYRDRSNLTMPFRATFEGSYSDTTKFPAAGCKDPNPLVTGAVTCLTDAQIREQLESFIAGHDLHKGMGTVFFLLTPPGVTVCLNAAATRCSDFKVSSTEEAKEERNSVSYKESFCSYHGDINPDDVSEGDESTVLYAVIPWSAGTLGMEGEYQTSAPVYANAFDCQDGGFNPEGHLETREHVEPFTPEEEAALKKKNAKERAEAEAAKRLEGPHIEEPNQEGKGEEGDYAPGLTDILINQISEEEMNTVTDPLLSSWHAAKGDEVTDLCRNVFASTAGDSSISGSVVAKLETGAGTLSNVSVGGAHYYINNAYNLGSKHCNGGVGLGPRFTPPDTVNAGEIIGVDGMESTIGLLSGEAFGSLGPPTLTYATFSWNFGDGTPEVQGFAPGAPPCEVPWLSPCAASAFHSYQYGGAYEITLTVTDVAGNKASVTHTVVVNGPPRPGTGSGGAGSGSGSSAGAGSTTGSGSTSGHPAGVPAPVAAAAVLRQSLHNALRKGLTVSYSVNEQVAGHFEVLLSKSLAHRIGISGTAATGLPAGTPPELVIAKAILVTTVGGRDAVHIQFSKRTAKRLAHVHRLPLMLRLIVHNASSTSPATTTVLTSFTLG